MKIKIIASICALIILIGAIFFINRDVVVKDITITVEFIKFDDTITNEIIVKDNLLESLRGEYELIIENGMIIKINNLESNSEYFIEIRVNDKFSNYGINNIKVDDGDKLSFIYRSLW